MYEKILVPLDGSKLAEVALPYAEELAGRLGSKITLISVLTLSSKPADDQHPLYQVYIQKMVENTKRNIERYVKTPNNKAIKVASLILTGDPAEEIVNYAEKEDVNLIIMGTRGQSGIKRWVLGSVADKVVNATARPVALVTTDDTETGILREDMLSKALVILDGTTESEVVIPYIEELASKLNIEVIPLQVVEQAYQYIMGAESFSNIPVTEKEMNSIKARTRRYLKKLAGLLEGKGITVKVKVVTGNSAETIIKVASKTDAGIIVMSTRGRSGISRWIFGSVRDEIVNIGNVLVLLIRVPD
ncbi:universal stress protein [Chloroflexota bacterium]